MTTTHSSTGDRTIEAAWREILVRHGVDTERARFLANLVLGSPRIARGTPDEAAFQATVLDNLEEVDIGAAMPADGDPAAARRELRAALEAVVDGELDGPAGAPSYLAAPDPGRALADARSRADAAGGDSDHGAVPGRNGLGTNRRIRADDGEPVPERGRGDPSSGDDPPRSPSGTNSPSPNTAPEGPPDGVIPGLCPWPADREEREGRHDPAESADGGGGGERGAPETDGAGRRIASRTIGSLLSRGPVSAADIRAALREHTEDGQT